MDAKPVCVWTRRVEKYFSFPAYNAAAYVLSIDLDSESGTELDRYGFDSNFFQEDGWEKSSIV